MSVPPEETELKFLCEPADVETVLAAAPEGEDGAVDLSAIYFDTPERRLRELGAGLRIRQEPQGRRQTLKTGKGLRRQEFEIAVEGDQPDAAHHPLRELLGKDHINRLEPLFAVQVRRRLRTLVWEGAEIELALDEGEILAGGRRSSLCEVELELKRGEAGALFSLARHLFEAAPLYLSFQTKADQGFALVADEDDAHHHAPAGLAPGMTAAAAFQAIARGALAQIAANGLILRGGSDAPEALHQLRVAVRRLRSAMSTFKDLVADPRLDTLKGELKWLAGACDEARNLDVFLAETYRPAAQGTAAIHGLADLGQALETARGKAHALARAAVASTRFRALLLELYAWIETGEWLARLSDGGGPATAFAAEALGARRRKLAKRGRGLMALSDSQRHQVRIQAKKLRYAAEAFRPLLKDKAARRLIKKTKALQAALGALNDGATAEALLTSLDLDGPALYAAGHLAGELATDRDGRLRVAAKAWSAYCEADNAW
ncbi:MAG: CHAD domain-containing protein [Phenylobacterium sp.]|uniref:CYTH and CHAD domain-containing protein n=1 Tax=Phenylobacterium sp. TaxID=1871053 RepID=UPI0027172D07|nr:CYTH and CHAD domain-containing protein [Phenylobacterium sp.]MDO8900517.1 CHAD domain-containing protein [Phenylobacterium sp.]